MLTIALRDGRIHGEIHSLAEDGAMFLELGATAILKAAVAYRVEVFTRTAVESLPRPVAPPKRVKCPILASVATKHLQFGPAALYWLGAPRIDPPLLSALLFFLLLRPRLFVTVLVSFRPASPPLELFSKECFPFFFFLLLPSSPISHLLALARRERRRRRRRRRSRLPGRPADRPKTHRRV